MKLKIGFSTCPNDTFMFDALVHNKIDIYNIDYEPFMADIEKLNQMASKEELDVTKLSYGGYSKVSDKYTFLNSGSALGKNNGPILISKKKIYPDEVKGLNIAIPGFLTTANMLLTIAYPEEQNKNEYLFSDIEEVVLSGEMDAGLIIHENRFTYKEKGLLKIVDLGEYWQETTNSPVPLGGIAIRRDLPIDVINKVDQTLRKSIEFAYKNFNNVLPFIRKHAQEMSEDVMMKHVNLYVNNYSIDIGEDGKNAVNLLYEKAQELKLIEKITLPIFINKQNNQ